MSREIKNARIRSTMLGWEDHGIFTCMIDLDYDGAGQGFGGYALDQYIGERGKGERRGTATGLEFLMRLCQTVGVEKWEDLPGKYVRAEAEFTKVHRIGHITADRWFDPADLFAEPSIPWAPPAGRPMTEPFEQQVAEALEMAMLRRGQTPRFDWAAFLAPCVAAAIKAAASWGKGMETGQDWMTRALAALRGTHI